MKKIIVAALAFFSIVHVPSMASAGVTVVQDLDFGEWLSYNNDAGYYVTVSTGGGYSYDSSGLVRITAPQRGIYDIDGLTPSATVASVVITQQAALTYSTGSLTMDNFQKDHDPTVDASGVLRITVGATMTTSGNSSPYPDGTYTGSLTIEINF